MNSIEDKINRFDTGTKILKYIKSEEFQLLKKESSDNSSYPRPKDVSMKSIFLNKIINIPQENITSLIENIL